MVIEKLATVIHMQPENRDGQTGPDALKAKDHFPLTASKYSYSLAPSGSHIYHLQGMDVLSYCSLATVMDQVHLEVARLGSCPMGYGP